MTNSAVCSTAGTTHWLRPLQAELMNSYEFISVGHNIEGSAFSPYVTVHIKESSRQGVFTPIMYMFTNSTASIICLLVTATKSKIKKNFHTTAIYKSLSL